MEKIKVLAIAPYEGLGTLIKNVATEWAALDVTVKTGNLEEGVKCLQDVTEDEFDVIISRGGTSSMIERTTMIPVIAIAVSGYDCVRAVKLAELNARKFAFIGFSNITQSASITSELLQSPVGIFTIEHEDEVEDLLLRIKNEGYNVVIGDVVTVKKAQQMRMNGILLTSGRESIVQAFEEAIRTVSLLRESRKRQQLLTAAFSKSSECLAVISETGKWFYTSSRDIGEEIRNRISDLLTPAFQGEPGEMLIRHQFRLYKLMVYPLAIDRCEERFAGVYIRSVYNNASLPESISILNPTSEPEKVSYPVFDGGRATIADSMEKINKLGEASLSILIEGERGTGKDTLAYAIHMNSLYRNYPYITLDCETLKISDLDVFFKAKDGIIDPGMGGSIYLRSINSLTMAAQHEIASLMPEWQNYRIIASSAVSLIHMVSNDLFDGRLYQEISQFPLHLPPLRERKEDIGSLAGLIIAEANSRFGKQVIGFEDDARTALEEYEWPFNIDELRGVIERVVILTNGSYIKYQTLQNELKSAKVSDTMTQTISIKDKTMEEIETEVIQMVLKAEDMNQNKTAKRLGISRSTIWRKIKNDMY